MNKYITLTEENLDKEHICCAIADKKHQVGVCEKKNWLKSQLKDGHVFRKLDAQGKVFIEYAPLEKSWVTVVGENYLYIYCLWVAGSFKGKGYAKELLEFAIDDAKKQGKSGLCVISSKKKKPFLSDKPFFEKFGFVVVDKVDDFELLCLSLKKGSTPKFSAQAKLQKINDKTPTIYYSPECPYTNNCIEEIKTFCNTIGEKVNIIKVDSLEKAKNVPCVFNNWATFVDGKYYSNVLLNKNSFEKLLK